jgi:phosphocarrier protein HPr
MNMQPTNAMPDETLTRAQSQVVLLHEGGLHARPSIKVTKLAKRFQAKVWIGLSRGGPWTDAKSIARVMAMKLPINSVIHFAAEGDDAERAVSALASLVEGDFADVAGDVE